MQGFINPPQWVRFGPCTWCTWCTWGIGSSHECKVYIAGFYDFYPHHHHRVRFGPCTWCTWGIGSSHECKVYIVNMRSCVFSVTKGVHATSIFISLPIVGTVCKVYMVYTWIWATHVHDVCEEHVHSPNHLGQILWGAHGVHWTNSVHTSMHTVHISHTRMTKFI